MSPDDHLDPRRDGSDALHRREPAVGRQIDAEQGDIGRAGSAGTDQALGCADGSDFNSGSVREASDDAAAELRGRLGNDDPDLDRLRDRATRWRFDSVRPGHERQILPPGWMAGIPQQKRLRNGEFLVKAVVQWPDLLATAEKAAHFAAALPSGAMSI